MKKLDITKLRESLFCDHILDPPVRTCLARGVIKSTQTCTLCGTKFHRYYRPDGDLDEKNSEAKERT